MLAVIGLAEQDEIVIRASANDILSWVVGVVFLVGVTRSVIGEIVKEWDASSVIVKIWSLLLIVFIGWLWWYAIDLALSAI